MRSQVWTAAGLTLGLTVFSAAAAPPAPSRHETVTVVANEPVTNVPGKRLAAVVVDYPPGAKSLPHRHAGSAFVYAYVLSGEIRSAVNDEPAHVYGPGEAWFEKPGAHHVVSENASDTKPARLLAIFVVDKNDKELTTPDGH
jgi:quercetin dioxygenase-like cupin family protein